VDVSSVKNMDDYPLVIIDPYGLDKKFI